MLFQVSVTGIRKVFELPGCWVEQDFRDLLNQLEVENVTDLAGNDLLEILMMALQDVDPEDAVDLVLAHRLQKRISAGSRQNIVQDLVHGQRPWEEFADIHLHSDIFAAAVLLNKALPKRIEKPDILQLTLHLQGLKSAARDVLQQAPEAAFVARLLADGLSEDSILERLFDQQLHSHSFPEAEAIIWRAEFSDQSLQPLPSATLTVFSSAHWLGAMKTVDDFKSSAYRDRPDDEDEEEKR